MPKAKIYNQEGKDVGEIELNPIHFEVKPDPSLVHQVMISSQANARHVLASTKTRGEIRGGGKKPWKQKGTGRARQGSIRSPQWVGGGIAFGPRKERNFEVKINRKVKRKAFFMVLSDRLMNGRLLVLESFKPEAIKTKFVVELIARLPVYRNTLFVVPKNDPELLRMVKNLKNVKLVTVNSLSFSDALAYPTIVFWKESVPAFENLYRNA